MTSLIRVWEKGEMREKILNLHVDFSSFYSIQQKKNAPMKFQKNHKLVLYLTIIYNWNSILPLLLLLKNLFSFLFYFFSQ